MQSPDSSADSAPGSTAEVGPEISPVAGGRGSLVAALREATAGLHAELEGLPALARLTSPAVAWADYLDYLSSMAGVYGVMEPPLFAALEAGLAEAPELVAALQPKLPALLADLELHGLAPPAPSPDPAPASLSTAVGGLYCLEGATLGGRVIARHLRRHLGTDPARSLAQAHFLDFHGESASAAWKAFAAALDCLVARGAICPSDVVAGAREAFKRVRLLLQSSGQLDT